METPSWLDKTEYPFLPHYLPLQMGRMHYVDEGNGQPVVLVHGTPVWSFLYRNLIKALRNRYRCIAPDHIGFGLSDKPANWAYTPEAHAANLEQLIQSLKLKDVVLVVHDFGGPIGLNYALRHPENVSKIVIMNTWLWPLDQEAEIRKASNLLGGGLGRLLYTWFNFSPRVLLKKALHDPKKLTPRLHEQYLKPFQKPSERLGTWKLAGELIRSGSWYAQQEAQAEKLREKPVLLVWGMQDQFIPQHFLERWQKLLPQAQVVKLLSGHFVQEEQPEALQKAVEQFLVQ